MARSNTPVLDHLVYAVPDTAAAAESIGNRLGVRPAFGGAHVNMGSHNYLLSFGNGSYLEIVGPDPAQPAPATPRPFGLDDLTEPRLITWAVRVDDIDAATDAAREAGFDPGPVMAMQRATPDGGILSWRLTFPPTNGDGAIPFMIDWGTSPHPSASAPSGAELLAFGIQHPDREKIEAALAALGIDRPVLWGEAPRLVATVRGPAGELTLG